MCFDEVSGDASQPTDYPNHPNINQKGILVKVEEDMVGLQSHYSPQHFDGSGDVEVAGVISDDGPGTTSRKSPMFSSSTFITSSTKTPNIYITSFLPRRSPILKPKSSMIPSTHNADIPITTKSSSNNKNTNIMLTNNSEISSLNNVNNNIMISSLNHMIRKSSIEDKYPNFNNDLNSALLSGSEVEGYGYESPLNN